MLSGRGLWANADPRGNVDRLTSDPSKKELHIRASRLEGAHKNGFEIFPIWATAVLAANYAGVRFETLNKISVSFIAIRLLYNYMYVNQNETTSHIRTVAFFVGLAHPIYLLYKAGSLLNSRLL